MHFYHQQNVFCNPPNQFRTVGGLATPSMLPTRMEPVDDIDEDSEHQFDDFPDPVWSGSENGSSSKTRPDRPPPVVYINTPETPLVAPNVDAMQQTFGISYTTAHAIETKLAKMLK